MTEIELKNYVTLNDIDLAAHNLRWLIEAASDEVDAAFAEADEKNLERLKSKVYALNEAAKIAAAHLSAMIEGQISGKDARS